MQQCWSYHLPQNDWLSLHLRRLVELEMINQLLNIKLCHIRPDYTRGRSSWQHANLSQDSQWASIMTWMLCSLIKAETSAHSAAWILLLASPKLLTVKSAGYSALCDTLPRALFALFRLLHSTVNTNQHFQIRFSSMVVVRNKKNMMHHSRLSDGLWWRLVMTSHYTPFRSEWIISEPVVRKVSPVYGTILNWSENV